MLSRVDDRIAFLVHEPMMYAHYGSLWSRLPRGSFVVVLTEAFRVPQPDAANARRLLDVLRREGYAFTFVGDVIDGWSRFRHVVSNHKIAGVSPRPVGGKERWVRVAKNNVKRGLNLALRLGRSPRAPWTIATDPRQYLGLQIGLKQIRFMYGADVSDGWSLQPWNEMYDLFLCHGPNDEAQLRRRYAARTFQMGYPRYDAYFSEGLDTGPTRQEFGLDAGKPTLLWMPTLGEVSSVPGFAATLAALGRDCNVIVRPHPLAFRQEPERIALLESLGLPIDRDPLRDMNALFKVADLVLCDYGGTLFSAVYLDKRVVILDAPSASEHQWTRGSSNREVMHHFAVVTLDGRDALAEVVRRELADDPHREGRAEVFRRVFADHRGTSTERLVKLFAGLDAFLAEPRAPRR